MGWLRIECADLTRGIDLSELSYEVTGRSSRAGHGTGAERRAFIRNNEGEALMVRGELGAAAEALAESHHIVQHPPPSRWMTWRYTTQCYAGLGQLALLQGDPERAHRLADQSLEVAVPTRSRKFESWAWRIKGEGATLRGAWGEAEDALRRALSLAEAIGQPRQTWLSHVALGRLDAANGRRDSALGRYRSAWAIITGLRARTTEPTLRAGLESSPLSARSRPRPPRITSEIEERHGFAGALRTTGGYGGPFRGPPFLQVLRRVVDRPPHVGRRAHVEAEPFLGLLEVPADDVGELLELDLHVGIERVEVVHA